MEIEIHSPDKKRGIVKWPSLAFTHWKYFKFFPSANTSSSDNVLTMAIDWRNSVNTIALGAIVLMLAGAFQIEAVRVTPAQPPLNSRRVSGE